MPVGFSIAHAHLWHNYNCGGKLSHRDLTGSLAEQLVARSRAQMQ
jgi:hypothetical protein